MHDTDGLCKRRQYEASIGPQRLKETLLASLPQAVESEVRRGRRILTVEDVEDDAAYVEAELIRSHGMLPEPLGVMAVEDTAMSQSTPNYNPMLQHEKRVPGRFQPGKCLGCGEEGHSTDCVPTRMTVVSIVVG